MGLACGDSVIIITLVVVTLVLNEIAIELTINVNSYMARFLRRRLGHSPATSARWVRDRLLFEGASQRGGRGARTTVISATVLTTVVLVCVGSAQSDDYVFLPFAMAAATTHHVLLLLLLLPPPPPPLARQVVLPSTASPPTARERSAHHVRERRMTESEREREARGHLRACTRSCPLSLRLLVVLFLLLVIILLCSRGRLVAADGEAERPTLSGGARCLRARFLCCCCCLQFPHAVSATSAQFSPSASCVQADKNKDNEEEEDEDE